MGGGDKSDFGTPLALRAEYRGTIGGKAHPGLFTALLWAGGSGDRVQEVPEEAVRVTDF